MVGARRLGRYLLLRASGEEGLIARRSAHHPRGISGICVGLEDSRNEDRVAVDLADAATAQHLHDCFCVRQRRRVLDHDRVRRYVRISIRAQEEYRPCS